MKKRSLLLLTTLLMCSCGSEKNITEPIEEHVHTYSQSWSNDDVNHWHAATCEHTTEFSDAAAHTMVADTSKTDIPATDTTDGKHHIKCSVCGYESYEVIPKTAHTHTFDSEWSNDANKHWHAANCGHDLKNDQAAHTMIADTSKAIPATVQEKGRNAFKCSVCGYETFEETDKLAPGTGANTTEEIKTQFSQYLKKEAVYQDNQTGINVNLGMYIKMKETKGGINTEGTPVVLYVINHVQERLGTEDDISIISDLLDEYIVILVDYNKDARAVSPKLELGLTSLAYSINSSNYFIGTDVPHSPKNLYTVPSGYRIARNIEYFNLMKHGVIGWKERTVDAYNESSFFANYVKKANPTATKATTIDDIVLKNGDHLTDKDENGDYKYLSYCLDITYPSLCENKTPVMMRAASNPFRAHSMYSNTSRIHFNGELFNGYTVVNYDHEYLPFLDHEGGYGHTDISGFGYTLQNYLGDRSLTAAARCVKYFADDYGYDAKLIGNYGISKASYTGRLADSRISKADPENLIEHAKFSGQSEIKTYGEQPYKVNKKGETLDATMAATYAAVGNGVHFMKADENYKYITTPFATSCGSEDKYKGWSRFFDSYYDDFNGQNSHNKETVLKNLIDEDINFLNFDMYGVDHNYPIYQHDIVYDYNYYEAFNSFFDYYLKNKPANVIYSSINPKQNVPVGREIMVQFVAPVKEDLAKSNLKVIDKDGNQIEGTWNSLREGNRYVFTPNTSLVLGEKYKILAPATILDLNDKAIEAYEKEFIYCSNAAEVSHDKVKYGEVSSYTCIDNSKETVIEDLTKLPSFTKDTNVKASLYNIDLSNINFEDSAKYEISLDLNVQGNYKLDSAGLPMHRCLEELIPTVRIGSSIQDLTSKTYSTSGYETLNDISSKVSTSFDIESPDKGILHIEMSYSDIKDYLTDGKACVAFTSNLYKASMTSSGLNVLTDAYQSGFNPVVSITKKPQTVVTNASLIADTSAISDGGRGNSDTSASEKLAVYRGSFGYSASFLKFDMQNIISKYNALSDEEKLTSTTTLQFDVVNPNNVSINTDNMNIWSVSPDVLGSKDLIDWDQSKITWNNIKKDSTSVYNILQVANKTVEGYKISPNSKTNKNGVMTFVISTSDLLNFTVTDESSEYYGYLTIAIDNNSSAGQFFLASSESTTANGPRLFIESMED